MATVQEVLHFIWEYSNGGRCAGGWVSRSSLRTYFARTDQSTELVRSMLVSGLLRTDGEREYVRIDLDALTPTLRRQMQDGPKYVEPTVHAVSDVRLLPASDGSVAIASGPGTADLDPNTTDDVFALLSAGENLAALDGALDRAARAARAGKPYERKVAGEDLGDVVVRSRPDTGDVELLAVPWADTPDPEDEDEWTISDGDVPTSTVDDDDNDVPLTEEQRRAWAAELQQELDERRAASRPPPPPSRSAVLDLDQVGRLRALLNVRAAPSGVPPGC